MVGFFSATALKQRQFILGDLKQQPPKDRLKCTAATAKELQTGAQMFILSLESEAGEKIELNCFERDLRECVSQWGTDNSPVEWGYVSFKKNSAGTRWQLVPAANQTPQEEEV